MGTHTHSSWNLPSTGCGRKPFGMVIHVLFSCREESPCDTCERRAKETYSSSYPCNNQNKPVCTLTSCAPASSVGGAGWQPHMPGYKVLTPVRKPSDWYACYCIAQTSATRLKSVCCIDSACTTPPTSILYLQQWSRVVLKPRLLQQSAPNLSIARTVCSACTRMGRYR